MPFQLARILAILTMTLSALAGGVMAASADEDEAAAIRGVINTTWDRADSKVQIDPVVVEGDAAIADWSQAEHGGRALLRKRSGKWIVVLCSGDTLKEVATLRDAGLQKRQALALAQALASAEAFLSRDRLAVFGRFVGLVPMEEPAHGHGNH